MPDGSQSWSVHEDDGERVRAVEAFLTHVQACGPVTDGVANLRDELEAVAGVLGSGRRRG